MTLLFSTTALPVALPDIDTVGNPDENGYEWITAEDGKNWYRAQGSKDDWVEFSN